MMTLRRMSLNTKCINDLIKGLKRAYSEYECRYLGVNSYSPRVSIVLFRSSLPTMQSNNTITEA